MKKHVLFSAAMVAAMTASAQTGEITSNRGENWLSQSGDWGLTFDATPLLNYTGNLFNGNTNNGGVGLNNFFNSTSSNGSQVVIGGKKLIDANTAYRGRVRIGFGSSKTTDLVDIAPLPNPIPAFPNPIPQVEDVTKTNFLAVQLGAGLEKRVGSTRVVGVYGGELNIDNQGQRVTEAKQGSLFAVGLNGFVGVEWFAAPKLSLSGEYTWGLALSSEGYTETTTEYWVPSTSTPNTGSVQSVTEEGGTKRNGFGIDTGVSGARIGVNFYFQ
jgi:hypothetical protein